MLGELFGESTGKRILRRVVSSEPLTAEVSFEDSGKMLGVNTNGFGTYVAVVHSDGTMFGDGQGVLITQDGEMVTWKASGLGRFKEGGAVSYRVILYYHTNSTKLSRLNQSPGVFEYEVDTEGKTHTKIWEWK
jgi:hypothetical protein